jgi:SAM-dependent methyltransferase
MNKILKNQKIYADKYKDKTKWTILRKAQYAFIREYISKISFPGLSLLDVGAGSSQFEDLYLSFKKTSIDFADYFGVDIIHNLEKGLPFKVNSFDIVASTNTFEHVYTSKELLCECYRVTKKGGMLIGSVPFQLRVHQEPHDYFRYTNFALEKMIANAGYSRIKIISLGTPNDLLKQTTYHFHPQLIDVARQKSILHYYTARVFWKIHTLLQDSIVFVFGQLSPSMKYTLGYGFVAYKL